MKKVFSLFLLLFSFSLYSQDVQEIKFFANDSAFQISDVNCKSFDSINTVTMTVPIPKNIENYDIFYISLSAEKNLLKYSSKTFKHDEIMSSLFGKESVSLILYATDVSPSEFNFWGNEIKFECKQEKHTGDPWEIIEVEAKPMNTYSTYNGDPLYSGNVYCKGQLIIRKTY
ncbi:MAG: hypothetical protein V1904_01015 [Bacteroidota bacterium]